ncbi:MAG: FGGY family carbohydrate kinase [Acidimicrobiaceae bacterium]|nr:FGGY family carbohydrate kinase [Acidimicrobiaceae bacterium]
MPDAYIGLDIGTTGIKAIAFDESDGELAAAIRPTPTHRSGETTDYDADELWETACDVLRDMNSQLAARGHRARAIAPASMAESGVLLDASGRPLAPVIAWFDQRTQQQTDWWAQRVGTGRTQQIAGVSPHAVFTASKMLWMREHQPEAWAAGRHWLLMADWMAYRLCAELATDYSLASRTMLFDLAARDWSAELFESADLDRALMAPTVQAGTALGRVQPDAATATGLPSDTVVAAGGHDHVCAAFALGVIEPGMLLDSIGTAEAFFLVTEELDTTGRVAGSGMSQGLHVAQERTFVMLGLHNGGGRIDAARQRLGLDWDTFMSNAAQPSSPERAVIVELARDAHERIAHLVDATGTTPKRHLVTGGGSRNPLLLAAKQELSSRPIEVSDQPEATALGAAMLARTALS